MRKRILFFFVFLITGLQMFAQTSVSGKVIDDQGIEIPGVNITVKGQSAATITGIDGTFTLSNVPGGSNAVLVFSFVGYKTQEVTVGNQKKINVTLHENTEQLEEVVVVGYGTARKKDVSGAITNVKFADSEIVTLPNPNAIVALSSKVAGMKYSPTNSSGGDNTSSITIRGKNAIPEGSTSSDQGVNAPLLIVDGVISYGSINEINTNDVQSIDVLKDASAAAIYGSRAANGVIIITTKKGQSETPRVNFNTNWSFSDWTRQPKMVTNEEKFFKNRFYARQASGSIPEDAVWSTDYDKAQLLSSVELDAYNEGIFTNWIDEVSRTGVAQKYDVNVSGNSKAVNYYVSGEYTRQEGIMKGDDYEKYNILSKVDIKAKEWLTIGLKGNFLSARNWGVSPRIQNATWMTPYSYIHARQEGYEDWYNSVPDGSTASPYWGTGSQDSYLWTDSETHNYNINGVFFAQIDFPFVRGLSYRFSMNGQRNTSYKDLFDNPSMWVNTNNTAEMDDPSQFASKSDGYSTAANSGTWNMDNVFTYTKDLGKHHFDLMGGYTRESYNYESLKTNFSNFSIPTMLGVYKQDLASTITISRQRTRSSAVAYLGRANYNYKNTYYATFNYRRDGYSAFADGHKWGNFYGASAAWVLSNESFLENTSSWLDYLKLRLSWGQNGSRSVSPYATTASVSTIYTWFGDTSSGSAFGLYPSSLPNKGLTWATVEKYNLGIDVSILKERLDGHVEIYTGKTTDMLMQRSVPYPTGFQTAYDNAGKVTNNGFEITVNSVNVNGDGKDQLRWTSNVVFDLNRNTVKSLYGKDYNGEEADDVANAVAYGFDSYYALMVGHSITSAYDFKKIGIFQSQSEIDNYTYTNPTTGEVSKIQPNAVPGDLKFQDYNNDGQINADDRHWIGDMDPLFTVNFGNTLTWKNFSLYFNFRWMQGSDTHFLGFDPNAFAVSGSGAQLDDVNPWTEDNLTNKYPRYGYNNSLGYLYWNPRTFVKLKDLVFSYNVDSKLLKKLNVGSLRLYVSGTDLFTLTGWSGLDPEDGGTIAAGSSSSRYGSRGTYKTISMGINLSF